MNKPTKQLLEISREGLTINEMLKEFKVSRATLFRWFKGYKIIGKIIICKRCGDEVNRRGRNPLYCKSCSKEVKSERNNKWKGRQVRRERENKIIEDFSSKEWLAKLENTKGFCPNCKKFKGIHNLALDHIHPISKAVEGQVYTIDDVQPLCKSCNSSKGGRVSKSQTNKQIENGNKRTNQQITEE